MHISSCLNPQIIYNPYVGEKQVVACGKCSACINAKAAKMVERLEVESTCHQFTYFCTLTYAPEHLPLLKLMGENLVDLEPKRMHWKLGAFNINVPEELHKIHTSREENASSWLYIKECQINFGGLPYLSSVDVQRFFKRLRSLINRKFKSKSNNYNEKLPPKVRYYLCAEIGPTTYRPHYHFLLFFDSQWLASHISEFIRETWQNGFVDSSPVEHSACSYVAQYLNSVAHLPAIYQTASLRPFAMFSKHPAIGTLIYNAEDLRQMFLSGTTEQIIWRQKKSIFDDVPLWRTIQNRLYPRLSFFDFIDNKSLYILYAAFDKSLKRFNSEGFPAFRRYVTTEHASNEFQVYRQYIELLGNFKGDLESKLQRWYLTSKRVSSQAGVWSISINEYVRCMLKYFDNFKLSRLNDWYQFCQDYSSEHDTQQLFWFDPLYLKEFAERDISECTYEELTYLESFGIDLTKFFDSDLVERNLYLDTLTFDKSDDYKVFKAESERILTNSTKTKKKNDVQYTSADWYADYIKSLSKVQHNVF